MKQYWAKYERVSTTRSPAQGRKQRPRELVLEALRTARHFKKRTLCGYRHGAMPDSAGMQIAPSGTARDIDYKYLC